MKGAGSFRVCHLQFGAPLLLDTHMHPVSSCSQQWVMGHHCHHQLPQGQEARGVAGLRDWWVVVVTYLSGTLLLMASCHLLVIPPLFIVIPGPVICQWGSSCSLSSIVISCPCCSLLVAWWFICNHGWWHWYCGGGCGAWELVVMEWKW